MVLLIILLAVVLVILLAILLVTLARGCVARLEEGSYRIDCLPICSARLSRDPDLLRTSSISVFRWPHLVAVLAAMGVRYGPGYLFGRKITVVAQMLAIIMFGCFICEVRPMDPDMGLLASTATCSSIGSIVRVAVAGITCVKVKQ